MATRIALAARIALAGLLALAVAAPTAFATAAPPAHPAPTVWFTAGTGIPGAPLAGPTTLSPIGNAQSQAIDSKGNLYNADFTNHVVEKIDRYGVLSVVAGNGTLDNPVFGPAASSPMPMPQAVAVDSHDNLYIISSLWSAKRVYKVDAVTGTLSAFAGNGAPGGLLNEGPALATPLPLPIAMVVDDDDNVYVLDGVYRQIYRISQSGELRIIAGDGSWEAPQEGPALSVPIGDNVERLAIDHDGNLYWTVSWPGRAVEYVVATGRIKILAGNGQAGSPSEGSAVATPLGYLGAIAVDAVGNVFFGANDNGNCALLRVDTAGALKIMSQAGCSATTSSGSALSASQLGASQHFVFDDAGTLWAGSDQSRIVRVIGLGPAAAPRGLTAQPGPRSATLSLNWASHGGSSSAVSYYQYSRNHGSTWIYLPLSLGPDGRATGTVTGLANDVPATILVHAFSDEFGAGPASSVTVTPRAAVPGQPAGLTATPGDRSVELSFSAPADDGGAPILGYEYRRVGDATWLPLVVGAGSGSTLVGRVDSLTNGVAYRFEVRAHNDGGAGDPATTAPVTPATPPGAPTAGHATRGDRRANLVFTAPGDDGGAAITGYEASSDGGAHWSALATTPQGSDRGAAVTGLSNGTTYTLLVRAVNAVGAGAAATLATVTPATTPGALQTLTLTRGDRAITISLRPPADDGGDALTGYELAVDGAPYAPLALTPAAGGTYEAVVSNLANGCDYRISVRAVNGVGAGPERVDWATPATLPDAPSDPRVTSGNRAATLTFMRPADGGTPMLRYEYSTDGATWATLPAGWFNPDGTFSATVGPLANGTAYAFSLRAVNAVGDGPATGPVAATPAPVAPGDPQGVAAEPRNGGAALTITPPDDDGGTPVTGYEVSLDGGTTWTPLATADAGDGTRTARVTGLQNGIRIRVMVRAVNAVGAGSSTVVSVTPEPEPPAAPTALSVAAGDASAGLSFEPGSDMGSPILRYEASTDDGATWSALATSAGAGTRLSGRLSGLTNRQTHRVRVRAVNAVGDGESSAAASVTRTW